MDTVILFKKIYVSSGKTDQKLSDISSDNTETCAEVGFTEKKVSVRLIMSDTFCLKTRSAIENIALDDNHDKYFILTTLSRNIQCEIVY